MKVCLTLICLFFLTALQDGETVETYTGKEGGNITVRCEFYYFSEKRLLCKETCEGINILIETTEDSSQKGRFSIKYERRNIFLSDFLHVNITDLKPSDSGRYLCHSGEKTLSDYFDLLVVKDSSEPKWTPRPFIRSTFHSAASTTTTTTTTAKQSQSVSVSSFETIKLNEKAAAASDLLLYVGLSLAVLVALLATALLIFCQKKSFHQQKGPAVETDPTDSTTINAVYEEIRKEDRENKPAAGEISSVYVSVQPNKPNAAESNVIYSLASEPQGQARPGPEEGQAKEGDREYSEVQPHLASSDIVIYSEPRLATSSGNHGNGSPPLYSTITLQE